MPSGAAALREPARPPRKPKKPPRRGNVLTSEPDYADEETEFIKAMDRFKREKRKPFPTWSEVLAVLKALGYRKVSAAPAEGGE
jgi:hypothetical protein